MCVGGGGGSCSSGICACLHVNVEGADVCVCGCGSCRSGICVCVNLNKFEGGV